MTLLRARFKRCELTEVRNALDAGDVVSENSPQLGKLELVVICRDGTKATFQFAAAATGVARQFASRGEIRFAERSRRLLKLIPWEDGGAP